MSSNKLHITRANYEEFFLLYVDGELTTAQNDAVEAFVAQHPDLQEELDLLLTTKLDAEPVFFNKETLMADSMKHTTIDENLLLYIDDELNGKQKAAIEEKLESDATYQFQHALLRQTKLTAEAISYPDKTELYRKEERAIRPLFWYRAAAAVFVLLASGYMWSITNKVVPEADVAIQTPVTKKVTPTTPLDQQPVETTQPSITIQEPVGTSTNTASVRKTLIAGSSERPAEAIASRATEKQKANVTESRVETADVKHSISTIAAETKAIASIETPQQKLNIQPVTKTPQPPYNSQIDADEPSAASTAVAIETENNKRGSVKGFLRKATRFIERRTGVSATNEDNELLIGALAINLK